MPTGCAGLAARRAEGYLKTGYSQTAALLPTHIVPQAIV